MPQNASLWQDAVKNLFDPCPVGWRVPKGGKGILGVWDQFSVANQKVWMKGNAAETGCVWEVPVCDNMPVWYSVTGTRYRTTGNLRELSESILIWTSTMADGLTYYLWARESSVFPHGFNGGEYIPANGHPVRCIRE